MDSFKPPRTILPFGRNLLVLLIWLLSGATVQGQQNSQDDATAVVEADPSNADEKAPPEFPDLKLPEDGDLGTLQAFVKRAKQARPRGPQDYKAMQTAIREASRSILKLLAGKEESEAFQQAELDAISAAVALMTFFSEEDQQKTVEQVHQFLQSREELSMQDVQTGMFAAALLELQPNKIPSRETYQLLDELLEGDPREEMQALRLNLQAAVRRLDLLGNRLDLDAETVDGQQLRTDDFEGQFLIIDFFATWCEPCLTELPRLKQHYARYHDQGLAVIGINVGEDADVLNKFLSQHQVPWPIVHDNHPDPLERLQMQFGVLHLPTVLLLNKKGIVISLEARGAELDRLVEMLFESPTPAAEPAEPAPSTAPEAQPPNPR